jgi:hypothetical protein
MVSNVPQSQIVECVQGEVEVSENPTRSIQLDWKAGWWAVSMPFPEVNRTSGGHSRHLGRCGSIRVAHIGEHSAVELKLV